VAGAPASQIQIAVKHGADISYFKEALPLQLTFAPDGRLEKATYVQMWKSIPDQNERVSEASRLSGDVDQIVEKLEAKNVFAIARRKVAEKVSERNRRVAEDSYKYLPRLFCIYQRSFGTKLFSSSS